MEKMRLNCLVTCLALMFFFIKFGASVKKSMFSLLDLLSVEKRFLLSFGGVVVFLIVCVDRNSIDFIL